MILEYPFLVRPWDIDQLDGLQLWLAAWKEQGYSDDDPVGTAKDFSGNGNDATQGTEAAKPTFKAAILNGLPVFRFDGSDDILEVLDFSYGLDGPTVFVVKTGTSTSGRYAFAHYETAGPPDQRSWSISHSGDEVNQVRVNVSADGDTTNAKNYSGSTNITAGSHILAFVFKADSLDLYVDGVDETEVKTSDGAVASLHNSTAKLTIGGFLSAGSGAAFWDADIAEVAMVDRALETSELQRVFDKLGERYGIGIAA